MVHQTHANPTHLDGVDHDVLKHLHLAHQLKAIIFRWNFQMIKGIIRLYLELISKMHLTPDVAALNLYKVLIMTNELKLKMPKIEEFCLFYIIVHAKPQRRQVFLNNNSLRACFLASLREENNSDTFNEIIV
jgi:hypothetical protein